MIRKMLLLSAALANVSAGTCIAAKPSDTAAPAPGTRFFLSSQSPTYVTADIEFRDLSGKKWPSFAYGKPADGGMFEYDPSDPKAAYSLVCDRMCQPEGDQTRRILGETVFEGKPTPIRLTIRSLGPMQQTVETQKDRSGKERSKTVESCDASAELRIGAKVVPVKANFVWKYPHGTDKSMCLTATFTIEGRELGLKSPGSSGPVSVRASVSAYPEGK
jgi:hypothetical protein